MDPGTIENGKLPAALLRELLALGGALPPDVLLAPTIGEDAGVVRTEAGALVVASDPVTLTGHDAAAHAVAVNANDIAVMGVRPRWFTVVILMPPGTRAEELRALFAAMHTALERLGVALVGGHTEITPAVNRPVVVGQMMGVRPDGGFVRTGGLEVGDAVLQIGPAPIEGAGVLAEEAPQALAGLDPFLAAAARCALEDPGISVVEPALMATERGACALHDPTEGGLSAGLYELAEASGLGLALDPGAVLWFEPGRALCAHLALDPWGTLASGALLAGFPPERVPAAEADLRAAGYAVARIARAQAGAGVTLPDGSSLRRYERDEISRLPFLRG